MTILEVHGSLFNIEELQENHFPRCNVSWLTGRKNILVLFNEIIDILSLLIVCDAIMKHYFDFSTCNLLFVPLHAC